MTAEPLIHIDFAVNDPDNGLFAGRVDGIQIRDKDGDLYEIEPNRFPGFTFTLLDDGVRLHRKVFKVEASKDWVGNWCWNTYAFSWPEGKRLIETLKTSGCWQCTQAEESFYQWFNEGQS